MSVRVDVDHAHVDARLDNLSKILDNPRAVWELLADEFAEGARESFATGRSDLPWQRLTRRYQKWKSAHGGGPLMVKTGKLRDSLVRRPLGVEQFTSTTATLGTDVMYAVFHPNRKVVWMSKTRQTAWIDKATRIMEAEAGR